MIVAVHVQQEQRLAAGSPLLQWAEESQWRIDLGVEASQVGVLRKQQVVELIPVSRKLEQPVSAVVESIAQQIDPLSHLVSVMVKPATKADFLLEQHSKLTLRLHRFYARLMKQVLPRPWLVLGAFVLLVYG